MSKKFVQFLYSLGHFSMGDHAYLITIFKSVLEPIQQLFATPSYVLGVVEADVSILILHIRIRPTAQNIPKNVAVARFLDFPGIAKVLESAAKISLQFCISLKPARRACAVKINTGYAPSTKPRPAALSLGTLALHTQRGMANHALHTKRRKAKSYLYIRHSLGA